MTNPAPVSTMALTKGCMSFLSISALVVGGLLLNLAFLKHMPYLATVAGLLYTYAIWKN